MDHIKIAPRNTNPPPKNDKNPHKNTKMLHWFFPLKNTTNQPQAKICQFLVGFFNFLGDFVFLRGFLNFLGEKNDRRIFCIFWGIICFFRRIIVFLRGKKWGDFCIFQGRFQVKIFLFLLYFLNQKIKGSNKFSR